MNPSFLNVHIIVEGKTEEDFVNQLLRDYLFERNILVSVSQISKPGQKGGDVRFSRIRREIRRLLTRKDLVVCTFVDYYGLAEWPGKDEIPPHATPDAISTILIASAIRGIQEENPDIHVAQRYIPFFAVHEFEAFLFSSPHILAQELQIDIDKIQQIIDECGSPEDINNHPETAPSKRLKALCNGQFDKVLFGVHLAQSITLDTIRKACPLFNTWLQKLEMLACKG